MRDQERAQLPVPHAAAHCGMRFHPPDAAALEAFLRQHADGLDALTLALAWRAGLVRGEIYALSWEQVTRGRRSLRLPDREVPLEYELPGMLAARQRMQPASPYVMSSERRRGRLSPASLSRLARGALDAAGMPEVRLTDLRYDYVRRQYAAHGWPHVLRVAGLSAAAYREGLGLYDREPDAAAPEGGSEDELRLWRLLQDDHGTPAGVALRLSAQLGLSAGEAVALTWDMVDFSGQRLRLPDREVPAPPAALRILEDVKARRAPGDDPHVLLSERDRRPMNTVWLGALVRKTLERGGIEGKTLGDFRRDMLREEEELQLLAEALAHGGITRSRAMALLGLSKAQAYARLNALRVSGRLVLIHGRYYPAGETVPPEEQREAVLRFLDAAGAAYRQDIVHLLGVGERTAARLLREMTAAGELVLLKNRQYTLPPRSGGAPEP